MIINIFTYPSSIIVSLETVNIRFIIIIIIIFNFVTAAAADESSQCKI